MIILDQTFKSITVSLSGSVTTNELDIVTSYVDISSTFAVSGVKNQTLVTNGTTAVTAVLAPASGVSRQLKHLSVHNADTVDATVTIGLLEASNTRVLIEITLSAGDTLEFIDGKGWQVVEAPTTTEEVQDIVGAMLSGNTETLITVIYQDGDGTIDFVVDNDLSNYDNSTSLFMPEGTYDPAGIDEQLVGLTATQTLTNKTLTSPDLTDPDITSGGLSVGGTERISSAGVGTLAQLNVDNLRADGNTISSTDTDGDVVLSPDGAGIISALKDIAFAAGKGVDFSANGGSVLAQYKDSGTFTPVFSDALTGGNDSPTTLFGRYVRVGKQVTVWVEGNNISTAGMTAGNTARMTDLPFTSEVTSNINAVANCRLRDVAGKNGALFLMNDNDTAGTFQDVEGNNFIISDFTSGAADINFTLTYEID